MQELLDLAKELGLKKNIHTVLEKAFRDKLIYESDINGLMPFRFTKAQRSAATLQLGTELEKKGVILVGKERPPRDFSILEQSPFRLQCEKPEDGEIIKTVFGQPEKKDWNSFVEGENEVIFLADGGISLNRFNSQGKIEKIAFYRKGDYLLPTDSLHASVVTHYAYFWKLPLEKLNLLPPRIKEIIIENLTKRIFDARLLLARAESRTEPRRKLTNEWMDEFYPDVEIPINSVRERAQFILLTRETLARKIKGKKVK